MAKKKKNICFVRLLTGDDLIGDITKTTIKTITIKYPLMVLNDIDMNEGKQTLILYPYIPQGIALGDTITIRTDITIFQKDVEPEIIEYYESVVLEAFSNKPVVTSSTVKKISENESAKGLNIISFSKALSKSKKDIN